VGGIVVKIGLAASTALLLACGEQDGNLVDSLPPYTVPDAGGQEEAASSATCAPGTPRIVVLDTSGALHRFDPELLPSSSAFQTIGRATCTLQDGGVWGGASSMAIDRNGVAWVTDKNGLLYKVSVADGSCEPTTFQPQDGFGLMGMGFGLDVAQGTETLYVVDNSLSGLLMGTGKGLATIDLASLTMAPIANFGAPLTGRAAELTSTYDGRLFGFFPGYPGSLAQIDPASASVGSVTPLPLSLPSGSVGQFSFALTFWNGVFFVYTYSFDGSAESSEVHKVDPGAGTTTLVLSQVPFHVTGAGWYPCPGAAGDN
jgi:hypothetical protein